MLREMTKDAEKNCTSPENLSNGRDINFLLVRFLLTLFRVIFDQIIISIISFTLLAVFTAFQTLEILI